MVDLFFLKVIRTGENNTQKWNKDWKQYAKLKYTNGS